MSYRCSVCNEKVKPGVAQRRHIVERVRSTIPVMVDGNAVLVERMEVAAELPVCERCDWRLRLGASLAELRKEFADANGQPPPEPPKPKPVAPVRLPAAAITRLVNNFNTRQSKKETVDAETPDNRPHQ